jgi:hypothetical protein
MTDFCFSIRLSDKRELGAVRDVVGIEEGVVSGC